MIQFSDRNGRISPQMAPKNKVEEPEKKPLIGRVGTNLRVGIVGVPNVGKSTFFNVLTKSAAPAENFPFCTIDPNENKYLFQSICELKRSRQIIEVISLFTSSSSAGSALRLPLRVPQAGEVSS